MPGRNGDLSFYGLGKIIVRKWPQKEKCNNQNGTKLPPRRKRRMIDHSRFEWHQLCKREGGLELTLEMYGAKTAAVWRSHF